MPKTQITIPVDIRDVRVLQTSLGERVQESGLHCFDKFINLLETWWEEITNYFVRRENSGFVEGFNNKVKVIKRRCYGIFNLNHLFQRIFLDLHGYRLFAATAIYA